MSETSFEEAVDLVGHPPRELERDDLIIRQNMWSDVWIWSPRRELTLEQATKDNEQLGVDYMTVRRRAKKAAAKRTAPADRKPRKKASPAPDLPSEEEDAAVPEEPAPIQTPATQAFSPETEGPASTTESIVAPAPVCAVTDPEPPTVPPVEATSAAPTTAETNPKQEPLDEVPSAGFPAAPERNFNRMYLVIVWFMASSAVFAYFLGRFTALGVAWVVGYWMVTASGGILLWAAGILAFSSKAQAPSPKT